MQKYGKGIVAFLYAIAIIVVPQLSGDHHVDASEGVAIGIAVCTAALTYLVPLAPTMPWAKTAIGAAMAGLQIATTVIIDGIDGNDILLITFAILSALGIALAPAVSDNGVRAGVGATTHPVE